MKKTHTLSNTWREFQRKKPKSISTWHLILMLVFTFLMFLWPVIGAVASLAIPSTMPFPVDWRIKAAFWVFISVWWFYVVFRDVAAKLPQTEARIEAKKKPGTRKALRAPSRRASRDGTDAV